MKTTGPKCWQMDWGNVSLLCLDDWDESEWHSGGQIPPNRMIFRRVVITSPSVFWQKMVKTDEQKDWRRKCENTAGNRSCVLWSLTKELVQMAAESHKGKKLSCKRLTCSLCSDHAVCYACIFSSAFEIVTRHWLVHKSAVGLVVTTAFALCMWFKCESSWKVCESVESPQWDPICV